MLTVSAPVTQSSSVTSPADAARLVREYLPLAEYLAVEKARTVAHQDLDELRTAAHRGLAKAALTYDPGAGAFSAFARDRINRSLLDQMRGSGLAADEAKQLDDLIAATVVEQLELRDGMLATDVIDGVIFSDHLLAKHETHTAMIRTLAGLPHETQRIVRAIYLVGSSPQDLAKQLGISVDEISQHRRVGLRLMREAMVAWESGNMGDVAHASFPQRSAW